MAFGGLTDVQWARIAPLLPRRKPSPRGGRPAAADRKVFEGILWILWTGAPWKALPEAFGSPTTCWRRLRQWEEDGTLLELWRGFLAQLSDADKVRWDECFIDGSFAPAKKGAPASARPSAARERSGWYWSMARVLRWEFTWTRHPRTKRSSSKRRSPRSR
ncbi:MAG: transposase [Candidatus Eisenbacteria bacterium]